VAEFAEADLIKLRELMAQQAIVDGRNMLNGEVVVGMGFAYDRIGAQFGGASAQRTAAPLAA
jgi:hypothetical protein